MTDGWHWHQPDGTATPATSSPSARPPVTPQDAGSPWWSDALGDPWRDPRAPAAVVLPTPPGRGAAPEQVTDPDAAPRRGVTSVLFIAVFSALLAGALGGSLGYALAVRGESAAARSSAETPVRHPRSRSARPTRWPAWPSGWRPAS
ncbi:hypothetical protein Psuf_027230 [Phytohabitans suffuscus]|uniref:Uncharacterized protein n=1 Tax=Phytohabitans suffuscus TaxID=624315 RepID=A0A6F8YH50_9ACTN|nr:hypothetical protein Psuf_027230 [Phytohabitans suffuscus]